jgi:hypothetical protein
LLYWLYYLGLPSNGFVIRQFCTPFVVFLLFRFRLLSIISLGLTNNIEYFISWVIMLIGLVCKMRLCLWITPIEELREEHKNRNSSESRTSSSNFDDNHCDGIWYVPNCISIWCWCRMEKRLAWVIGGLIVHYS